MFGCGEEGAVEKMTLPKAVERAIETLTAHGYEAYAVGGCVRDFLRGVTPSDYDLTTSATPSEILSVFSDMRCIETGIAHGTVTVIIDETPLEITTFRIDGDYRDHRHPDSVTFTRSFREDAARRDFTVNAMGYAPGVGVVDCFGGREDLRTRTLRAVGDPNRRFTEDSLRILRALRFASVLGMTIEKQTKTAANELAPSLESVASERIYAELCKLLCGKNAFSVLNENRAVVSAVLPELMPSMDFEQKNRHHIYDVYTHTLHVLNEVPPQPHLRFAALFHDIGKPHCFSLGETDGEGHFYGHAAESVRIAEKIFARLHADRATSERALRLIRLHDGVIECNKKALRRMLARHGEDALRDLIALKRADTLALHPDYHARTKELDEILSLLDEVLAEPPCFSVSDLAIGGDDLLAMGVPRGPLVGQVLRSAHEAVMAEAIVNNREELLAFAQKIISSTL